MKIYRIKDKEIIKEKIFKNGKDANDGITLVYPLKRCNMTGSEMFEDYCKVFVKIESNQKRKVRHDAVLAFEVYLTLPAKYKDETQKKKMEFFESAGEILTEKFGPPIWAAVHGASPNRNEYGADYLHVGFISVTGDGKLSAKDVLNRRMFLSLHDHMDKCLKAKLEWYDGGVVSGDKNLRMGNKNDITVEEYKKIKTAIRKEEEHLELLKRENGVVSESVKAFVELAIGKDPALAETQEYQNLMTNIGHLFSPH